MNLKEALKLHRFEIMKRRGLPPPKPQVDYERLNYYAFERHITRIDEQNERMIAAVEKISNKQAEPVAIPGAILMGQVAARSRSIPERAAAVGDAE
jgi:hypothetical protein